MTLRDFIRPEDTVALVGNAPPERDFSAEIEACGVVVRFSKVEHYGTGRLGRRTDLLVIQCNQDFLDRNRNWGLLDEARHVFYRIGIRLPEVAAHCTRARFSPLPRLSRPVDGCTTGCFVYAMIREFVPDSRIRLFAYSRDRTTAYFRDYNQRLETELVTKKL